MKKATNSVGQRHRAAVGTKAPKRMSKRAFQARQRYRTRLGAAYSGDAIELMGALDDESVQAIITSPPFALKRKKQYGNPTEDKYIDWFLKFVPEFRRILKKDGSLVIDIGGAWMPGSPTRSIYQFELLIALVRDEGFFLAEEFYWFNRAKLPGPVQWVNIERSRVKDAVNPIWWLGKTEKPKADNRRVLKPYSPRMEELFRRGYNKGRRPSGHKVGDKFGVNNGGAIPPNLIEVSNTRSRDSYQEWCREQGLPIHPARFPREIPEFFIEFLSDEKDLVLDPFGGSNVTGAVAEQLRRRWITFELNEDYLSGSIGRFPEKSIAAVTLV
jgi:site-specific DNA-methyltransferase (cytosine-N4-specific)